MTIGIDQNTLSDHASEFTIILTNRLLVTFFAFDAKKVTKEKSRLTKNG